MTSLLWIGVLFSHDLVNLLFFFSYFGISTSKKNRQFADRVFTPQKKSKKTRFANGILLKKWPHIYNYLLLLLYYLQITKCYSLWASFSCECPFTRHFSRVYTKALSTQNNLSRVPYIVTTQQTAPPHHYPSQLLSLSSLSDWATELLSRYQNG